MSPNQCTYCSKIFIDKLELEKHILNILLGNKVEEFCLLLYLENKLTIWLSFTE